MCGVAGIFGHPEAANLVYLMLYALQHRGQESAGIVSANSSTGKMKEHKAMGLVRDVFDERIIGDLRGSNLAIGHVRYSTTGESSSKNMQPILAENFKGPIAVAHNGNIVNATELRHKLEGDGSIFQTSSDSEVILHLIARSKEAKLIDRVQEAIGQIRGAFSLLILTNNHLIAVRDPFGFRDLVLGKLDGTFIIASETCALDLIGAQYIREIEPGEILVINKDGERLIKPFDKPDHFSFCVFELIYFMRPDSFAFGRSVDGFRKMLGRELAKEDIKEADFVCPVPDSSNQAALGYAHESGIAFDLGIIRNHYVGRTFIEPSEKIRHFGVKIKLNPVRQLLNDKKIVVVDDSIVRATTSQKIVEILKNAGAQEVHFRSSCPRIINCCYYGIDIPVKDDLIASRCSDAEICKQIDAATLKYQTLEGLRRAVGEDEDDYCYACLGGSEYPVPIPEELQKIGKIL
ncbi:MAG TPA: amidophosphoribosyltransferase [Candidatus Portnoybacteria bacterium]|uniref:Amidophosphoribosyltransferase n=1 Tax=Candidatus Portnoybacteria bacterium CG02_land_8_20_14_3_00_45_8 TaxID=1974807 RepID=A0A2M7D5R1_9BACT|nr:MAG: amidophosphoribosyltransferase [Candidatus Portnoybacteria bacterium CG02_land_8_20_14_3_00_45_8]HCX27688.1 amidophosphoribosyltransferase [Candidatus Portnoybacteria bacterium]